MHSPTPRQSAINTPTLSTERLHLRGLRVADASDVLVFRGDPIVQRFDDPPISTIAEAEAFIEELLAAAGRAEILHWAITHAGVDRVVGLVTLQQLDHNGDRHHRRAEVGYGIAHALWGRGIGSEAVRAVVDYGFDTLGLNRIYARTIADNNESVRLLERLGFIREGTQRQHSLEDDGRFHDSAVYGLLRTDWGYPPVDRSS